MPIVPGILCLVNHFKHQLEKNHLDFEEHFNIHEHVDEILME